MRIEKSFSREKFKSWFLKIVIFLCLFKMIKIERSKLRFSFWFFREKKFGGKKGKSSRRKRGCRVFLSFCVENECIGKKSCRWLKCD